LLESGVATGYVARAGMVILPTVPVSRPGVSIPLDPLKKYLAGE
jgi:hypothetical protein